METKQSFDDDGDSDEHYEDAPDVRKSYYFDFHIICVLIVIIIFKNIYCVFALQNYVNYYTNTETDLKKEH